MKHLLTLFAIFIVAVSYAASPKKVIFDTDMGNDVDDALALDMLYKYADMGQIDLIGIVSSKREMGSVKFIDAMNTLYGYSNIPLGIVKTYPEENYEPNEKRLNYADYVVAHNEYPHTVADYDALPDGYILLRRLLSEADERVTIIAVGFSTNLARLLASQGDEISPLSGRELIERKVERVVIMAGNFNDKVKEYNVYKDHYSAVRVFEEWPTEMLFSDFALGKKILFPYTAVEQNFSYIPHHPVREAFEYYAKMPYNRPTWDLTAVLFACEPKGGYATLSAKGYVVVDAGSVTHFTKDKTYNRRYYIISEAQRTKIRRRLVELTAMRPKSVR